MIFIVCGGRHYQDERCLWETLDHLHDQYTCTLLLTGGAPGADRGADRWAERRGIDRLIVPANWERDGPPGGPMRNTRLLRLARLLAEATQQFYHVIAFPGGPGTANMIRQAEQAGVRVLHPLKAGMDTQ